MNQAPAGGRKSAEIARKPRITIAMRKTPTRGSHCMIR
jgi:hypothetical protein